MTLRTEIVTDLSRFLAIKPAWRVLWEQSGGFVFQDYDWISGWLAGVQHRRDVKFQLALVWDGEKLCGAMPCAIHRRSGIRQLTWAAQVLSDYCDCLLDPVYEPERILLSLWDSLYDYGGFDLINLQQIRPDAKCRGFLERMVKDDNGVQVGDRSEQCMRIENHWANGEAFFRSLNKKARNNHTRGKRILSEMGSEVRFRCIEPPEEVSGLLDEIMRLKTIWLRATDPASPLLGPDQAVLRGVLNSAWRSGLARVFVLECGGKIAAASINFVYAGRMEAYFTAYDLAFDRASPGTILIIEYARWSFDRNLRHVDFLRGEQAFKFRLANNNTVIGSFSGARTLMGQLAISGHRWLARRRHRPAVADVSLDHELQPVS